MSEKLDELMVMFKQKKYYRCLRNCYEEEHKLFSLQKDDDCTYKCQTSTTKLLEQEPSYSLVNNIKL